MVLRINKYNVWLRVCVDSESDVTRKIITKSDYALQNKNIFSGNFLQTNWAFDAQHNKIVQNVFRETITSITQ